MLTIGVGILFILLNSQTFLFLCINKISIWHGGGVCMVILSSEANSIKTRSAMNPP